MQYTEDFKRGIVRTLLASGMTRKEFAAKTKITVQALRKWVKQYKDEEIKNVDHNNRSKYSEEYKKSIVSKMLFDGITYETMSKKTGISSQLLEYWDNKYRYILIDEFEKRMANRRKKKVKKEARWHRYGAEKNDDIRSLPWIICKDGFRMSVQVGRGMNSIPKHIISDEEWENGKRYVCVECGVLNAEEEALKPYAEDSENLLETIYAYVPANLVDVIIKIHGGMMNEEVENNGNN